MVLWFNRKSVHRAGRLLEDTAFYRILERDPYRQKIVITRRPQTLKLNNRIYWIYISKVPNQNHFDPSRLYALEQTVWKLLQEESSDVVLDAFEYIMMENGLETALKFTGKLRDMAVLTDSDFYVTVSNAVDEKTRHILRRILE
jgi:hypothetical protein